MTLLLAILIALDSEDLLPLQNPAAPRVAFAVERTPEGLRGVVEVEGGPARLEVGLAAAKKLVLGERELGSEAAAGVLRFRFAVPAARLIGTEADWSRLRLAFAVAWGGGPAGGDRQRERYRHLRPEAPHAGLSADERDWEPLDLAEHEAARADRRHRIWIPLRQPLEGKASLVIEDAQGRRIRNLVSGKPFAAGATRVEWDGFDDAGRGLPPGSYRWRSVHHPGLNPEYLFSFDNDGEPGWRTGSGTDMWGPDHSALVAATASGDTVFLGGSCAESGYAIVAVDAAGRKFRHYSPVHGTGIEQVALASDGKYLYVANDGFSWGQHVDKKKAGWKGVQQLTLSRFDAATGSAAEFPGGKKYVVVDRIEVGPGSDRKEFLGHNLAGLAWLGGKLYVSARAQNALLVVDPATGQRVGELPLPDPGALAVERGRICAVSSHAVVSVDPADRSSALRVPAGNLLIRGLAVDAAGLLYVSDGRSHQVHVFDRAGKPVRTLGKPGGDYAGPFDPERMLNPAGLAIAANGRLWVAEERFTPKRVVAWDLAAGTVALEKFGPTSYGASGAGFDPRDPTRWVGQGAVWKLDLDRRTARPQSILGPIFAGGTNVGFHHQDGRTFLIAYGGVTALAELRPDGSARNLAFAGSTHRFAFHHDWNPPAPFVEAFARAYPSRKGKHADKGPGVLWVDVNGDGAMQAEEFDFSTEAEDFAGSYWGHAMRDLVFHMPAKLKGRTLRVAIAPQGWHPGGAPKYPPLNEAVRAGVPLEGAPGQVETAVDRFGTLVANLDPELKGFKPDGSVAWTFPNRWSGVHGSHAAPLPERGVTQGTLFFLGMAPFDAASDVFVMNGNHGRFFAFTSDGLYLDELFKDVRMGAALDAYLIGGECFGGFFGRSEKDGRYYLQSGHTDYRIFRLHGLEQASRAQGAFELSAAQAVAAENRRRRTEASAAAPRDTTIPFGPPGLVAAWDRQGKFPAQVRASHDGKSLQLRWEVQDSSPWVNRGNDWTLLFKTGDSVDVQIGADPAANPKRSQPVPGDFRLLIAPFEGKDIAVLYRHRLPGAADPVTFTCPWRSEKVDSVRRLDGAKIAVQRQGDRYTVDVSVALADLGLGAAPGKALRGDFGVIYGDPGGTLNMLRSYWSNAATGLVNDVPGEVMLTPSLWGTLRFEERR